MAEVWTVSPDLGGHGRRPQLGSFCAALSWALSGWLWDPLWRTLRSSQAISEPWMGQRMSHGQGESI